MKDLAQTHMLDVLCPMHLILDKNGCIAHSGPTVKKLCPDIDLRGTPFFDVFVVKRPKSTRTFSAMCRKAGSKMHLSLRAEIVPRGVV